MISMNKVLGAMSSLSSLRRWSLIWPGVFLFFLVIDYMPRIGNYIQDFYFWGCFILSVALIVHTYLITENSFENKVVSSTSYILMYMIFWTAQFPFSQILMRVKTVSDISFVLCVIIIILFLLSVLFSFIFTDYKLFDEKFSKNIKISNELIYFKGVGYWQYYSLGRMSFLRKPLQCIGMVLAVFVLLFGKGAAGMTLGVLASLKETHITGTIEPHIFVFFLLSIFFSTISGFFLYSVIYFSLRWHKLLRKVKKEYGHYRVIIER